MIQRSLSLLLSVMAVIIFFTRCPFTVGKCTYDKEPVQHGIVKVKSVEIFYSDKQLNYRVTVEGLFTRDFIYSEDEYNDKFSSKGYRRGSEIEATIHPGGPCPPIYKILEQ